MATLITVSGRRKDLPETWTTSDFTQVAGLDEEGRIVMDWYESRTKPPSPDFSGAPTLFGLTLCCDASDKGMQDGVGCRGCYHLPGEWNQEKKMYADAGRTLYMDPDGTFPGLDPVEFIEGVPLAAWLAEGLKALGDN